MPRPRTFQEQLDVLAHGGVQPVLLVTDVERRDDLLVHVVLVDPADGAGASGHASTLPVFTRRFPVPDGPGPSDDDVRRWRAETVTALADRLRTLLQDDRRLTYAEIGATEGLLPPGYAHLDRRRVVGRGRAAFERAAEEVMTYGVQRGAGLRVRAARPRASTGDDVTVLLGPGRWAVEAPCRVVATLDTPTRRGFAYGTLEGHPESGEERFVVEHHDDDAVTLAIRAFSRPAWRSARLAGPAGRLVQRVVTERYLRALG